MKLPTKHAGRTTLLVSLAILASCSDRSPTDAGPEDEASPSASVVEGLQTPRHIVLTSEGEIPEGLAEAIAQAGGDVLDAFEEIGVLLVGGLSEEAVESLRSSPGVERITEDEWMEWVSLPAQASLEVPFNLPSDPSGALLWEADAQWNLYDVYADAAWAEVSPVRRAVVAILDSGVDTSHPDLQGKIHHRSRSFVGESIEDDSGHGTFVAGIVSTNGMQAASVAPEAEILVVKVLSGFLSNTGTIIAGIMYAVRNNVDVINMSLLVKLNPAIEREAGEIEAMARAAQFASRRGILVVAGTGNDALDLASDDRTFVPVELPGVLGVGATTVSGGVAGYSNFGEGVVDLVAPGGDAQAPLWSLRSTGRCDVAVPEACVGQASGTSYAAPHVSGAAAVVQSLSHERRLGRKLYECLIESAEQVGESEPDPRSGNGLVDVLAASRCAWQGNAPGRGG